MGKEQIKPIYTFKISIKGDKWNVNLYTNKKFEKLYRNCIALCEYDHKRKFFHINFQGSKVSKDTIAHELQHAFLSYRFFHPFTRLSTVEEMFCEATGKNFKRLYLLTNLIYNKFKGYYAFKNEFRRHGN